MTGKCPYAHAAAAATALALAAGAVYWWYKRRGCSARCDDCIYKVNLSVDKSNPKVVNNVDIEDIGDKAVFCRCWRSAKFPYCDGSHNNYNKESGDNVGPLIVEKKQK